MADELHDGTQAATIGVEHTLNSPSPETTTGIFQIFVDLAAMLSGDTLEIRVKEKVRSSTTQRLVYMDTLTGVQTEPAWVSPATILFHGWDVTLKQTAGTGRSFPWSIRTTSDP
jgi:hypothetical protein